MIVLECFRDTFCAILWQNQQIEKDLKEIPRYSKMTSTSTSINSHQLMHFLFQANGIKLNLMNHAYREKAWDPSRKITQPSTNQLPNINPISSTLNHPPTPRNPSSYPMTFKKVSCCPAKEASGKSSAVAEDRTAKVNFSSPPETRCHWAWEVFFSDQPNGASKGETLCICTYLYKKKNRFLKK